MSDRSPTQNRQTQTKSHLDLMIQGKISTQKLTNGGRQWTLKSII